MKCLDAYFGIMFDAELADVIKKTKLFNEKCKDKSYVFGPEYLEYLKDMCENIDSSSMSTAIFCYGFQTRYNDTIVIKLGLLDGNEILIVHPWNR